MIFYSPTTLVFDGTTCPVKEITPNELITTSSTSCHKIKDRFLNSNTPFSLYQKNKIIQKTVRVPSSQYMDNLSALQSFQSPQYWSGLTDRKIPHIQQSKSTKRSLRSMYPTYQSPGGSGVDVKHGSYHRYMNTLKGRCLFRQGKIPTVYPPTSAFKGGKMYKTNIVSGYYETSCSDKDNHTKVFTDPRNSVLFPTNDVYCIGQEVFVFTDDEDCYQYEKATILEIIEDGSAYLVQIEDTNENIIVPFTFMSPYIKCVDESKDFVIQLNTSILDIQVVDKVNDQCIGEVSLKQNGEYVL